MAVSALRMSTEGSVVVSIMADTGADLDTSVPQRNRFFERVQDPTGGRVGSDGLGHVSQQHRELVASETSDGIAGAYAGLQSDPDLDEEGIAAGVAEAVVDRLEVIKVNEKHRSLKTAMVFEGVGQMSQKERPVGQIGQGIMRGLERETTFQDTKLLEGLLQASILQRYCGVVGESLGETGIVWRRSA